MAEVGLEAANYELQGEQLGKIFTLRFLGEANLAARRLNKFMDNLKLANGGWRGLDAQSPTGTTVKLYVNRDRNPRQVKEEVLGKRLQKIVAQQLAAKGNPLHCFYKKHDTTLFVNWQPVAKLIVEGPEAVSIRWNVVAANPLDLDRDAIVAALDVARESASSGQWSV